MRNLILFLIMMISLPAIAQERWDTIHHEADEMLKQKEYTSYVYEDEDGNQFIFWSNDKNNFRLINRNGLFDADNVLQFRAIVGYYDENGKFIKKEKKGLAIVKDDFHKADTFSFNDRILKFLKEQKGYIRILAPEYQSVSPWEIIVPCMKGLK